MKNYKIRVNNEARADEAKELFKKLGYHHDNSSYKPYVEWIAVFEDGSGSFYSHNVNLNECVEITIAQLRDLVVLKRNDVKDANYRSKSVLDGFYFKSSDGIFYFMFDGKWVRSTTNTDEGLELITKDLGLISGSEALRALADGKEVEGFSEENKEWIPIVYFTVQEVVNGLYKFRLKPQTVKLELELPKPFDPKEGEEYFGLNNDDFFGYSKYIKGRFSVSLLAFRTEDDAKKAVEQLRKIKGAV
ncbi:hypothetical protein [Acinetobacter phage VB_AB_Acb75]|nr:hypothetical protein Cato_72 [Acinetobacter phage Cato]